MSEAAARNWCEKATEPYRISIEEYTAAIREITEFREMLMRKYQIDEATLDQLLKKRQ